MMIYHHPWHDLFEALKGNDESVARDLLCRSLKADPECREHTTYDILCRWDRSVRQGVVIEFDANGFKGPRMRIDTGSREIIYYGYEYSMESRLPAGMCIMVDRLMDEVE